MVNWIEYVSGNVPGGIYLYGTILIITLFILVFMYRVNELFHFKHFVRWLVISWLFFTIIYAAIWLKNPPYHVYKRYTVGLIRSSTENNWLGKYLTEFISEQIKPFREEREYFLPHRWFYRITPLDSAENSHFMNRIYRIMPVQCVLSGEADFRGERIRIRLKLMEYPSQKVLRENEMELGIKELSTLPLWLKENFSPEIPFKTSSPFRIPPLDEKFIMAKQLFYRQDYEKSRSVFESLLRSPDQNPIYDIWYQYARIRWAGEKRGGERLENPYGDPMPGWRTEIQGARQQLLKYLKENQADELTTLLVAESYIWEEDYQPAEIFLKKAYIENPFDVDVLLNFSFLHPSRYRELGFGGPRELYEKIVVIFPLYEAVLSKWSQYILENNPAYTAPPEFAKNYLERYLRMNPYSHVVWSLLGQIYSRQRERILAKRAFLKADSLSPDNAWIQYNLGVLHYEWGKYEEARRYFLRSIEIADYLDSYLYLGAIYKNEGDYQKALDAFRYRVEHKQGENDAYAYQAMKGIRECLEAMNDSIP
ncbi:MAG: hypothetical protein Kow0042_32090 [Calditrichia bacterium]